MYSFAFTKITCSFKGFGFYLIKHKQSIKKGVNNYLKQHGTLHWAIEKDVSLLLNKYSNAIKWNKTELDKNNFNVW